MPSPDYTDPDIADRRPYEARLFGAFTLAAPDGRQANPVGRKARALLAFLLLADFEDVPRERLAGLLWSERGEEQARASLRQALYELRTLSAAPAPLLVLGRGAVRVARERLVRDLDGLRQARDEGGAQALADRVGERPRDLLADLDGIDPAFDDWLAAERVRRADERRALCMAVAGAALEAGDAGGARRLADALLACDATDEGAARLAMAASHRLADRDALRQTWTRLERSLQQEVGVAPSAESATLYRRLMADDSGTAPSPPHAPNPGRTPTLLPPDTRPPPRATRWRRRAGLAAALLAAMAGAGGTWLARRPGHLAAANGGPRRLIVVEPLASASNDAGALALAGGLSAEVSRMIVGNAASMAVADARAPVAPAPPVPPGDSAADLVVAGDARSDGGMLHVNLRLHERGDAAILWSAAFTRPVGELDALREQVATRVAAVLVGALGGRDRPPESIARDTLRSWLGACDQIHSDTAGAAKLLAQVVQDEPRFAHAWAMLAWADARLARELPPGQADPMARQADAAASRALALDATQGDAQVARALLARGIAQWDGRMALLSAAHVVDPGNARVDGALSGQLALAGRTREAIANARASVDADPFDPEAVAWLAELLGFSGESNESGDLLAMAARRFPEDSGLALSRFRLAVMEGDPRLARRILADPERGFDVGPKAELAMTTLLDARTAPTPAHLQAAVQGILIDARRNPRIGLHAIQRLGLLEQVDAVYAYAATLPAGGDEDENQDVLFSNFMAPVRDDPRFMVFAARQGLVRIWQRSGHWPDFCTDGTPPYDCRAVAGKSGRQSDPLASK